MLVQYTKNNPFDENYEPASIFPLVSKVYEKVIDEKTPNYFEHSFQ